MHTILFNIIRSVICDDNLKAEDFSGMSASDWSVLYQIAKQQGLTAVIFDKIQSSDKKVLPPKELVLRWVANTLSIEKRAVDTYKRCAEFARLMHEHGLNTLVLKGVAVSHYYPNPYHREYGDLDCYFYKDTENGIVWDGCYEEGNNVAEQEGFFVDRGHYKHSHITYRGLEVENHQFSLPIKDGKRTKALERELRKLIESKQGLSTIGETFMYCPTADFNALFLTAHAMSHFLYECIRVRNVLDWALFLKTEQDNVDWNNFWQWCERMHYTRFVQCLNYICVHYLGLQIHAFPVNQNEEIISLSARMLKDIFEGDSLYRKGYKGLRFRLALASNYFKSMWKFHRIYQQSAVWLLVKRTMGMFVKNVKL
ncbi:MAG: nucleotidyltransferase family protein [Bacteroidaceae bacterium]|nr:nucleotidyltransferase family protein [Bacteroidaceae bacterium]